MQDVLLQLAYNAPALERFNSRIDKSAGDTGCWPYLGVRDSRGYGIFYFSGFNKKAHRASLVLATGIAPKDKQACHNCPGGDNPLCVNPKHLFWGTPAEHGADRKLKGQNLFGVYNPNSVLTEKSVRKIVALRIAGKSAKEIAKKFNVAEATVEGIIQGRSWVRTTGGIRIPAPGLPVGSKPGEAHPGAKLRACSVIKIRRDHARGISTSVLAQQYGVTFQNIRSIVQRKTWGCIP